MMNARSATTNSSVSLDRQDPIESASTQHSSLDWIAPGLSEDLFQSLNLIESYLSGEPSAHKLTEAAENIQAIEQLLKRSSIPSAAMLADNLAQLCFAIADSSAAQNKNYMGDDNAFPALYGGISQLVNYLETLKKTHNECIGAVVAVVNDVRAAAGYPLLVSADYFDTKISGEGSQDREALDPIRRREWVPRGLFQDQKTHLYE